MRLGKEEARGFIEEPAEVSVTQHDPLETEAHPAEPVNAHQQAPGNAPEDQPASSR